MGTIETSHPLVMVGEGLEVFPVACLPKLDITLQLPRREELRIRGEGDRCVYFFVIIESLDAFSTT